MYSYCRSHVKTVPLHHRAELGTRQLFRFATTTTRQLLEAFATSDNATNFSLWAPRQRVSRQRASDNYILATTTRDNGLAKTASRQRTGKKDF